MGNQTTFPEWLRQRRHLLDLKQTDLASLAGCSAVTIRKLESGERKPSAELARELADALRIPLREQDAFIQFARSDEWDAAFRLPAWNPEQASWRSGQLPRQSSPQADSSSWLTLHYTLTAPDAPQYEQVEDGRFLIKTHANGPISGDIEGHITLRLTQIIMPKPAEMDYATALPMQVSAFFTINSGDEQIEGFYNGSMTPMLDPVGNGNSHFQGTGQVVSVTAGFIDLFLNYVFVTDVIRMVEGVGTGANGSMQLKPAN